MVVITIMSILMVVVAIAFDYTSNETRNVQRSTALQTAYAVGDSAIDVLFNQWRNTCRTSPSTVYTTSNLAALATPSPFPNMRASNFVKRGTGYDPKSDSDYDATYVISNYKVIATSAEYTALASTSATPEPALGQLAGSTSSVSTTTSATWNYMASADVTLPVSVGTANNRTVVAKVRRVFTKQQLSPWNWAIFYSDPLEIHPGPSFTVTGWVHTNSDLYTGHSSLTFADKVTYGSDWFVGFMPGDGTHPETPGSPNYPGKLPPARDQALQPFGLDSTSIFSSSDGNANNDSYHELIEPPITGNTDPLSSQRYWDQAAIIIQVNPPAGASSPGWDGVNGHDTVKLYTVNASTGVTTALGSGTELYKLFATNGAITTNQPIQDNREGATVTLTTLDISKLTNSTSGNPAYAHAASNFASNPIVYIYDKQNTTSNRRGVRIKNGSKIPTAGLTIASQGPVYIQGDFNTGGTGASVPSNVTGSYSDPANPPNPQVSGYTRAPTSILADAVTILSNNWSDANSSASLPWGGILSTPRTASNTTVNTAIVSGIVATNTYGDNAYSGGAENFPRFLEDWSSSTLSYYGSMVELYQSKYSTGEWGKANVYNPPTREWFFDNNFKITPPPGSLMVISYNKGQWALQ
ncbi:MAG: hypothetical protein ACXWHF_01000 [Chthoniobacterales bacterium]